MDRRNFIARSTAFATAAALSPAIAIATESAPAANALLDTSTNCVKRGRLCLQHCMESLSSGSKAMAECAAAVREMLVTCDALAQATALKSKHLKSIAKIARDTCLECETECRKHDKMAVCHDCAEACARCAEACASA